MKLTYRNSPLITHLCRMYVEAKNLLSKIFEVSETQFSHLCLDVFRFQYQYNPVYQQYCTLIKKGPASVRQVQDIPFLPISLFKTFEIKTTDFDPEAIFESSGTTGSASSRHFIKDLSAYEESFLRSFRLFYGEPEDYCILGLLPSYLEKGNSSLVYMVTRLCELSGKEESGFYLYNYKDLAAVVQHNILRSQKTMLIGVTYALLDFAEEFPMEMKTVVVMETGGMKGRKKEMLRENVHEILKKKFSLTTVHSEYGMTELLSQAYSKGGGILQTPPWMKMLWRAEDDPLYVSVPGENGTGVGNIIDLANLFSCSFIACDDLVKCQADGSFEVLGRLDHSDLRGCSLLTASAV